MTNKKRMSKRIILFIIILFLLNLISLEISLQAVEEFSQQKAYENLATIAGNIGPRPMGSPAEKSALKYFADKIAEYGGKVEWQAVTGLKKSEKKDSARDEYAADLNANSFNVIGRFPGTTSREIIIGAHIDSLSPEIPGADDDGSGVATMLELARVISKEVHASTIVFVAFCGEESGLIGSKNFVEKYSLKNVALMLQLDMTTDDSPLLLWMDTKKKQTPDWLVSASIDTFHALGYRKIDYPTHFQSLNSSFEGAGSDHEPFLQKGIPAIAFVSDLRFPIHTRNDSLTYFKADGLERSGKLVLELIRKFDREQPAKKTDNYMLLLMGERPVFVRPYIMIIVILVSMILATYLLIRMYRERKEKVNGEEDKRIRFSWPKLLVLHLVIIITTFASLWFTQLVKGQRVPWYANPVPQVLYALPFFILGIWLALQILKKWKIRINPFFYYIRAFIYLSIFTIVSWIFLGPRFALYSAIGLLFISLACLVRSAWLKGLFWILSPYLMLRMLVLPEYFESMYRTVAHMGLANVKTFWSYLLVTAIFMVFMMLWSMPFLLGFVAVHRSHSGDLLKLRRFRSPVALIPIGILIIAGAVYLYGLPSYTSLWEQQISVIHTYDSKENKNYIEFRSSDYLRGLTARIGGKEEVFQARTCMKKIDSSYKLDWLHEQLTKEVADKGNEKIITMKMQLTFDRQPYSVSLKLNSDKPIQIEKSNMNYSKRKKNARIRWFSYPPKELLSEMKIRMPKDTKLDAEIIAIFLETPVPITCEGKHKYCIYRSEIKREVNIFGNKK